MITFGKIFPKLNNLRELLAIDHENVFYKKIGKKEIYFVGTAHVSPKSAELVREVIKEVQPDTVCLELDEKRFENIMNKNRWENLDVIKVFKEKRGTILFASIILSAYQNKWAKELSGHSGGEMVAGYEEANKIGANVELVDRDINTTFKKIWRSLSLKERVKLPAATIIDEEDFDGLEENEVIEKIMQMDLMDSLFGNFEKSFPAIHKELLAERNKYIVTKLAESKGRKIVCVLGKAHIKGVLEELGNTYSLKKIEEVPPKKIMDRVLGVAIPVTLLVLIIFGFFQGFDVGVNQIKTALLWNSGFAALFTLLGLGTPLAVVIAFVTAPIGTFSPFLSVGMFTAIVQAFVKKPKVSDFERISEDVFHFKKYFTNKALHVFTIFFISSIGGLIGNLVAGLDLFKNLF